MKLLKDMGANGILTKVNEKEQNHPKTHYIKYPQNNTVVTSTSP